MRSPWCTARRKPSAAAIVNLPSLSFISTPVSTGRDSSVAAAKATREIAARIVDGSAWATNASSTVGMGGNSEASVPLMLACDRPDLIWRTRESGSISMSMRSFPRELTKSASNRAGTVTDPSSSTIAPTQVVMAISRLVADSRSIPWSAASNTF